jgi:hypothetical protein
MMGLADLAFSAALLGVNRVNSLWTYAHLHVVYFSLHMKVVNAVIRSPKEALTPSFLI